MTKRMWMALISLAGLVVAGLYLFHSRLYQVIEVQILLKLALLLAVAIPYLRNIRSWRHSVVLQEAA